MQENSYLKLSNFLSEASSNICKYEERLIEEKKLEASSHAFKPYQINRVPEKVIPTNFLQDQLDVWGAFLKREPEIDEFFTDIYVNRDFQNKPGTTIPVYDVGEIKGVRPQYLSQYVTKMKTSIAKIIAGDYSLYNTFDSEKDLESLKKNIVMGKVPSYSSDTSFVKLNNKVIVSVNISYITSTLLPFIRSANKTRSNVIENAESALETISESLSICNAIISSYNKMVENSQIDNPVKGTLIISAYVSVVLNASKYMIACLMRQIFINTSNFKEYCTVKDELMMQFNNGADVLHESVIDGNYDFRDEDIVVNMINGRTDITDSIINRIIRKFRTYLSTYNGKEFGDDLHSLMDLQIENSPFDLSLYKRFFTIEKEIWDGIVKMQNLSMDPDISIEDIQIESGLGTSLLEKYSDITQRIRETDLYSQDAHASSRYDECMSILNELQYAKKFFVKFNGNLKSIFDEYTIFQKRVQMNDNDEFENHERNKEELLFLNQFDKDFRQFLLDFGRAYMERLKSLEEELVESEASLGDNIPEDSDMKIMDDFLGPAIETVAEMDTIALEAKLQAAINDLKYMEESAYVTASPIVFFEDENDQNNNNSADNGNNNQQNQNNTQTTNNNGNDKDNNSNKPQVVDNSSDSNQSDDNTGSSKGIIQKLKDFISNIIEKIKGVFAKFKPNTKWLADNKEALTGRSYNNVTINNLTPYNQSISYMDLIHDVSATIADFKNNPVGKTEEEITRRMFRKLPKVVQKSKDLSWNEALTNVLKYGNVKPQDGISVSNGELKTKVADMIAYCEDYYANFATNIENATNDINTSISGLENKPLGKAKNGNEKSPEETLTFMATQTTTLIGVISNVARDRANEYINVLRQLVPKKKPTNTENNSNNNSNENSESK